MTDTPPTDSLPTDATSADTFAPTKASISGGYRWRPGLIALFCIGFGLYCLYDGFIAYPKQIAEYDKLEIILAKADPQHPEHSPEYAAWSNNANWPTLSARYGIEGSVQEVESYSDRTQGDVITQFIMAGIVFPIGAYALFIYLASGSRFVEADEHGVRDHKGQSAAWSELTGIESPKWDTKGIARLVFRTADGTEGRILLDDWKYDTEPVRAIYREALRHTDPEAYAKEMQRLEARQAALAAAENAVTDAGEQAREAVAETSESTPDRSPTA